MLFVDAIQKFEQWKSLKSKIGTIKGYSMILRQFSLYMRNSHIEEVKLDDVIIWFKMMGDLNYESNSFIPKSIALRKFFEFYQKQNYKVIDPWLIPLPRKIYNIPRIANEESYEKLLNVIPKKTNDPRHIRNLAIINLLWDTGVRNGEICALNISELKVEEKKAIISTEKSRGKVPFRQIFWSEETNKNLIRWLEKRDYLKKKIDFKEPNAVFISAYTQKVGQRFTRSGLSEMLRRYSDRAKIPSNFATNAHSFRHHKCRDILKNGGNSADVMNIAGHSSINSGSIYQMLFGQDLEDRARKFIID